MSCEELLYGAQSTPLSTPLSALRSRSNQRCSVSIAPDYTLAFSFGRMTRASRAATLVNSLPNQPETNHIVGVTGHALVPHPVDAGSHAQPPRAGTMRPPSRGASSVPSQEDITGPNDTSSSRVVVVVMAAGAQGWAAEGRATHPAAARSAAERRDSRGQRRRQCRLGWGGSAPGRPPTSPHRLGTSGVPVNGASCAARSSGERATAFLLSHRALAPDAEMTATVSPKTEIV
jgi:hypothetical protein